MIAETESLLSQIKDVYRLWYRAIYEGQWWLYFCFFAFTLDEHEDADNRDLKPLVNDDYDVEWIKPILEEMFAFDYDVFLMVKSRQQRVTWIFSHFDIYMALSKKGSLIMLQSTKKTNKAEELMRKHGACYNRLPSWAPSHKVKDRDCKMNISNESRMVVLSEETDDAASLTFNVFNFDEMSLHPKAKKIFGVCLPGLGIGRKGGGRFYGNSSPRQGSYHVELCMDEFLESSRKWIIKRDWSKNGLSVGRNKRGHKVVFFHYSANAKKNELWKNNEKKNYDDDVWEREFELNPDAVEGKKVYRNFNINMIKEVKLRSNLPLIRGWDLGNRSAVVWMQYDDRKKTLYVLNELIKEYSDPATLVYDVNEITEDLQSECRGFNSYIVDFPDPFSCTRRTFLGSEIFEIEQKMFEICKKRMRAKTTRRVSVEDGIAIVRSVISQGMEISQRCHYMIKGFRGAYVCKSLKDEPAKDGYYDHIFDAFKYPLVSIFNIIPSKGLIFIEQMIQPVVPYKEYKNRLIHDTFDDYGIKIYSNRTKQYVSA